MKLQSNLACLAFVALAFAFAPTASANSTGSMSHGYHAAGASQDDTRCLAVIDGTCYVPFDCWVDIGGGCVECLVVVGTTCI